MTARARKVVTSDWLAALVAIFVGASLEIVFMSGHLAQAMQGGAVTFGGTPLGIVVGAFLVGLMYTLPCVAVGWIWKGRRAVIPAVVVSCVWMTLTVPRF